MKTETIMNNPKLSELIAIGAKLAPFQSFSTRGIGMSACALEGARRALEQIKANSHACYYNLLDLGPDIGIENTETLKCPHCNGPNLLITEVAMHLNDAHRWSREKIADFLAKKGY